MLDADRRAERPTPWIERPTLALDAGRPMEERFRHVPAEAVREARVLLNAIANELPPAARRLANLVRLRTANRFHREVAALAAIVGADWRDLMVANVTYELVLSAYGCSTVALPTPSGPVLARNMDWFPEDILARASYLVRVEREGGLEFSSAGWPGAVGVVTGISARGFGIALNAVVGPDGIDRWGYPVLLHVRRVLEDARDFGDALDRLSRQRLAASALFTLVGTRNEERVVIERSPREHALRWGADGQALITTNDYRLLDQGAARSGHGLMSSELYRTTCLRYDALCRFFAEHDAAAEAEDDRLLSVLTDPSVIQTITAQHVILRPRQASIRLLVPRKFIPDPKA